MTGKKIVNFSPGPSKLPEDVILLLLFSYYFPIHYGNIMI